MITLEHEISNVMAALRSAVTRQVRFAAKQAINDVAYKSKEALAKEAKDVFDRPTPTTVKAGYVTPAKSSNLQARVFLKDFYPKGTAPNRYLAAQIRGGNRDDKRSERLLRTKKVGGKYGGVPILPPGYQTFVHRDYQNQYGNITGSRMVKILSELRAFQEVGFTANRTFRRGAYSSVGRPKYFVVPVQSGSRHPGIYERKGGQTKLIIGIIRKPRYEDRYEFSATVKHTIKREFAGDFRRRYTRALQTMRIRRSQAPPTP